MDELIYLQTLKELADDETREFLEELLQEMLEAY